MERIFHGASRKDAKHEAKPVGSEQLAEKRKASEAINRRFTQMDTERKPVKNITAEAPFDALRMVNRALREPQGREPVESVEPPRAQRIKLLFVGRRRQTKTLLKLEL